MTLAIKFYVCVFMTIFAIACNTTQVDTIEQNYIIQLPGQTPDEGELVHHVLLDVKDDLTEDLVIDFLDELRSLHKIEGVKNFHVGQFQDLGDARALSLYEFMMSMSFEELEDYESYQKDEIHQRVKEKLDQYLAGPPATYDLIVE